VNKIREIPQHPELLVTHTDSPELYLWNMEKQPNRSREKVDMMHEKIKSCDATKWFVVTISLISENPYLLCKRGLTTPREVRKNIIAVLDTPIILLYWNV
jgi:hypothetical protein